MKIYLQPIAILNTNLIILCCKTNKEANKLIQGHKEIGKYIKRDLSNIDIEGVAGKLFYHINTSQPLLLFVKDTKKDWNFYGTLVHELNHAVYYFMKSIGTKDETEFEARLQEMLFKEIRKSLI